MTEKQGRYGDLIKEARKQENQKTSEVEDMVNLCAKVPKSHRQHWAAESKRKGVSMTEVMIRALKEEFGMPE